MTAKNATLRCFFVVVKNFVKPIILIRFCNLSRSKEIIHYMFSRKLAKLIFKIFENYAFSVYFYSKSLFINIKKRFYFFCKNHAGNDCYHIKNLKAVDITKWRTPNKLYTSFVRTAPCNGSLVTYLAWRLSSYVFIVNCKFWTP